MSLDWISGDIDGVDKNLLRMTQEAWQQVIPGARIEVTTGVSSHSPTNHAPGHAVDYRVTRPDGSTVWWDDPEARAAADLFWELGGHGVGAGPGYMGGSHFHWDISANGVRAWSDDDGAARDRGPGAAQWFSGAGAGTSPSAPQGAPQGGYDPSRPPSVFNPPPGYEPSQRNALTDYAGAPEQQYNMNALAALERFRPRSNRLDPEAFRSRRQPMQLMPMPMLRMPT